MSVTFRLLVVIVVIWIAAIIFCWWLQRKVLFFPASDMGPYRPDNYQPFYVDEEGKGHKDPPAGDYIAGWYIPATSESKESGSKLNESKASGRKLNDLNETKESGSKLNESKASGKTVFFCHGNTGNIGHRDYVVELCKLFGLGCILFDYSGYGQSKGSPSMSTLFKDGERAYVYARSIIDADDLIVWGESLGGSVATMIASKYRCAYLVLLSTFSSLDDILLFQGTPYHSLLGWGLRISSNTLRSKDRILNVTCPVAIVHSLDDSLIPFACARALYERVPTNKLLIPIHGGHATPVVSVKQINELMDFLHVEVRPSVKQLQTALDNIRTAAYRHGLLN